MADIKNIKVVDAEVLDVALNDLAESIRTKSGVKGDLAFPDPNEFKSAVDIIDVVKNETKPETITSNGNHPTDGYSNVDVDVPVGVFPTETINIVQNNISNMDITNGKTLNVNVPVKHFATGVISNVTAGQQVSVTGIVDAITGETFNVRGVICFISPTTATNFQTAANKPGLAMFYKDSDVNIGATLTCVNTIYSVRAHPTAINSYLTINGNSFTLSENTASMYGIIAAPRWRWYAWG